jgi:hypothetical protein
MSIQSWKWRNIDSRFQFIIFSGNYSARSSQNALQWVNCRDWTQFPDPLWRHPSYGQVGIVRTILSSTETPECLPDIHEGPPNLAESNDYVQYIYSMYIIMAVYMAQEKARSDWHLIHNVRVWCTWTISDWQDFWQENYLKTAYGTLQANISSQWSQPTPANV